MMLRLTFLVAITCGLLAQTASAVELFTFSTISDGVGFNGEIDAPSNSGNYTFTTALPSILQENAAVIFMFESGGSGGQRTAELNVLDLADSTQIFTVNSLDWRNLNAQTGGGTLTGYSGGSGGTQEWQISGEFPNDPLVTLSNPTTGSFASVIDTVVIDLPNYVDGAFMPQMDNLSINIIPEPASLGLLGLGGLALISLRRRR